MKAKAGRRQYTYLTPAEFDNSDPAVPCVKKSAVSVFVSGVRRFLHANTINVRSTSGSTSAAPVDKQFVVGMAPVQDAEHQGFLVDAIESEQGLFQLVPRHRHAELQTGPGTGAQAPGTGSNTQASSSTATKRSVLQWLLDAPEGARIADRYTVMKLEQQALATEVERLADADALCIQYLLTVRKDGAPGDAPVDTTIPITQAAVKFDNNLMQAREIGIAKHFLDEHLKWTPGTQTPRIISQKGIGRSATLMVYQEISTRMNDGLIDDAASLHRHLVEVIENGLEDRGPQFIHTLQQFIELRSALLARLDERQARARDKSPMQALDDVPASPAGSTPSTPSTRSGSGPLAAAVAASFSTPFPGPQASPFAAVEPPLPTSAPTSPRASSPAASSPDASPALASPAASSSSAAAKPAPFPAPSPPGSPVARERTASPSDQARVAPYSFPLTSTGLSSGGGDATGASAASTPRATMPEASSLQTPAAGEPTAVERTRLTPAASLGASSDASWDGIFTRADLQVFEIKEQAIDGLSNTLGRRAVRLASRLLDPACSEQKKPALRFEIGERLRWQHVLEGLRVMHLPSPAEVAGMRDALPGPGDCKDGLIVAVLQHATGDARIDARHDMAMLLREAMLVKFPGFRRVGPQSDSGKAMQWLCETVNALYGRDLAVEQGAPASPDASAGEPSITCTPVGGGTRRPIWSKAAHYSDMIARDDAPVRLPPDLAAFEGRIVGVLGELNATRSAFGEQVTMGMLDQCLLDESARAYRLIAEIEAAPLEAYVKVPSAATRARGAYAAEAEAGEVGRVLDTIRAAHPAVLRDRQCTWLKGQFFEAKRKHIQWLLQPNLHRYLSPNDFATYERAARATSRT